MPSVVLLLPQNSYRADDFVVTARKLGIEVIAASDRCHVLAEEWTEGPLPLDFNDPPAAARALSATVRGRQPRAVIGPDDQTAVIAALASAQLGLAHNPPEAVAAARNKAASRQRLREGGVPVPWFEVLPRDIPPGDLQRIAARLEYPCVLKPLVLSGSRGVIRADDARSFAEAFGRIATLLRSPQVAMRRDPELERVLVEGFLPGPEVALEGLLTRGRLRILALFDKPEPLDGPFFEETLYVTPSRHPAPMQETAAAAVEQAAAALGLSHGPVHAELRLTPSGPRILEVAARSIGGLCGRALRFGVGMTLEELLLRHALDPEADPAPERERKAAGVLMLPIRKGGVLQEVRGIEEARSVPGIEDVVITAHLDEEIVPLPEGASYLGFAFARGDSPQEVESALRRAGEHIEMTVAPKLLVARRAEGA